ncbi:helix-turn-helix domain-containing protein [Nocardiopsis sp. CC223A]|uniref:helix-turn-helix domain-containing protein n=1 Tax=Nocardiopsis sp. CC223A TaxID=3044051 RepID=UPI00278BF8D0|nr:helix-turn-helix domain-containing protein [Nocardiopsis sp. CC223A]
MNDALGKGIRVAGENRSELAVELKRRYDAGESIRQLAAATGRSYGFVHRLLGEAGVELRGRGGATRKA